MIQVPISNPLIAHLVPRVAERNEACEPDEEIKMLRATIFSATDVNATCKGGMTLLHLNYSQGLRRRRRLLT